MRGIDVSHWSGTVSWRDVSRDGQDFVYIKATEGINREDPVCARYIAGARKAGLHLGVYHYLHTRLPGDVQARWCLDRAEAAGYRPGSDMLVALDLEDPMARARGAGAIREVVQGFVDAIKDRTGRGCLLYGSRAWLDTWLGEGFGEYPLWLAHYSAEPGPLPKGWSGWTVWQYSDHGSVDGVMGPCDVNRTNGRSAFMRLLPPAEAAPRARVRVSTTGDTIRAAGAANPLCEERGSGVRSGTHG